MVGVVPQVVPSNTRGVSMPLTQRRKVPPDVANCCTIQEPPVIAATAAAGDTSGSATVVMS